MSDDILPVAEARPASLEEAVAADSLAVETREALAQQAGHAVADLLAESKAAHVAYQQAVLAQQPSAARAALAQAAATRAAAHQADPDHLAPAWSEDAVPGDHATSTHDALHEPLLVFYDDLLRR